MKIKLFIDEDMMSRSLLKGLRARGIDVLSVLDEQRVGLLTLNLFCQNHITQKSRNI
jgi:hypothetical protein